MSSGLMSREFEESYKVDVFPTPVKAITLVDGVSDRAVEVANELGLYVHDLRKIPGIERKDAVLQEALNRSKTFRSSAWLGRGDMDNFLKKAGAPAFWQLREGGGRVVSRLGNGVGMGVQDAIDNGMIVERTPRGNAEAVRIWQDLMLYALLTGNRNPRNNPVIADDLAVKNGSATKFIWDREDTMAEINPESRSHEDMIDPALDMSSFLKDKKVAIIGFGRIAQEVVKKSPFLMLSKNSAFDLFPPKGVSGVRVEDTLEDALRDASLVLLHMSGDEQLIGEAELKLLAKDAIVCNLARGGIVDPKALFEAIESGRVKAAGLDTHVVEGDKLVPFSNLPANSDDWQPGHYAVALRMHENVVATNHSAANDKTAQGVNAEDGVRAVYNYLMRGRILDPILLDQTEFPFDAFMQERDGHVVPVEYNGSPRAVFELLHDGKVPGLMDEVNSKIAQKLGFNKLNIVGGTISPYEYGKGKEGRRNSIGLQAVEIPEVFGKMSPLELQKGFGELIRLAESHPGMRTARAFFPQRKSA